MPTADRETVGVPGLQIRHDLIDADLSRRIRADLLSEDRHEQSEIIIGGDRHPAPRLTSSFCDRPVFLDGMAVSRSWPPELSRLRETVGRRCDLEFNYALANLYRTGADYTGWHCDKAWLHQPGSTIAIASFGATRTLAVRSLSDPSAVWRVALPDSSVVLMGLELQATHEHCIMAEPDDAAMRLSITLRHIKMLPEYLDDSRQRRQTGGASSMERDDAHAVHGES